MITVIDYGAGNLRSVQNALERLAVPVRVADNPSAVRSAQKLILPGVGHFGQMMRALDDLRLRDALLERMQSGVPFLGICLGLQALYQGSDEAPDARGLGLLSGQIQRFDPSLRVPHMGWNNVQSVRPSRLLAGAGDPVYFYFANSYHAPIGDETASICTYGVPFAAVVEHGNQFGVQFHPEKSGRSGLRVLQNFAELEPC